MNLAFPALLILLYILPGVVFVRGFQTPASKYRGSGSRDWITQIPIGTILALPIHWVWLQVAGFHFFGYPSPNLSKALLLLTYKEDANLTPIIKNIAHHSEPITLYFCGVNLFAGLCGIVLGAIVVAAGFQRSRWENLFKAPNGQSVLVSAVVERSSKLYLYVGLFHDRMVDREGNLHGLWLKYPEWRPLEEGDMLNKPNAGNLSPIDANLLFLAIEKVQTLGFKYLYTFKNAELLDIRRIAESLWDGRKHNAAGSGSPEEDWERAKLILLNRIKFRKGWRSIFGWAHIVKEMEKSEEDKIRKRRVLTI